MKTERHIREARHQQARSEHARGEALGSSASADWAARGAPLVVLWRRKRRHARLRIAVKLHAVAQIASDEPLALLAPVAALEAEAAEADVFCSGSFGTRLEVTAMSASPLRGDHRSRSMRPLTRPGTSSETPEETEDGN
eukprot:CAMPEP_0185488476 /NCGR_PEP_ID=MMETSP1366-20130426/12434_1 /TAXON_ID=38817 /ORGANISM="Gephyrocapsa oceanica, Strain RCC1303" /LENGTH=138 /DNA_ID=CAMNT_0028096955 /DNA_START=170 /DNA_END=588 /DNA_ORIENTATION=-